MKTLVATLAFAAVVAQVPTVEAQVTFDDVDPLLIRFRDNGEETWLDHFYYRDWKPCVLSGFCAVYDIAFSDNRLRNITIDDFKILFEVDGTLPDDYTALYWDLDAAQPSFRPTQYQTKGTNWAACSQYVDINNWYLSPYSGGTNVNRIEWGFEVQTVGNFPFFLNQAIEVVY